jgi:hypothetical protein
MLQLRGGGTHGKLFRPSLVYKDQADRQSRDCVNEKVAGVGGGGGTCYNCGEAGHMVCPPQSLLGSKADDSPENVPNPPFQAPSEANVITVVKGVIK